MRHINTTELFSAVKNDEMIDFQDITGNNRIKQINPVSQKDKYHLLSHVILDFNLHKYTKSRIYIY